MSIGDVTSQMFGSFLQYMGKKPEVMIHGLWLAKRTIVSRKLDLINQHLYLVRPSLSSAVRSLYYNHQPWVMRRNMETVSQHTQIPVYKGLKTIMSVEWCLKESK